MVPVKNPGRTVNLDDDTGEMVDGLDALDAPVAFEDIKGDVLIPLGEYRFRNTKVDITMSKSSNKPMFNVKTIITSGEFEGTTKYFQFSWSEGAQPRSKKAFVGMGMPEDYRGSVRGMAEELLELEYYAMIDTEQSDGINEKTQRPYDPRNKVIAASQFPITGS